MEDEQPIQPGLPDRLSRPGSAERKLFGGEVAF